MTIGAEQGKVNEAAFIGPSAGDATKAERMELKLGHDFHPLALAMESPTKSMTTTITRESMCRAKP
jgi:hypothetical protein